MTLPEHGDLGWDTPLNNAVQAISADAAAAKADALAARNDAAYAKQAVDTVGIDDLASALSDAETAADTATTKASLATGAASSAQSYATQAGTARTAAEDARDAAEAARTDLLSQKGAASGVAPLDSDSRVPQGNLPAHLDPTALTASTAAMLTAVDVSLPPFNAVGNGTTNDTTAIQSALNAAPVVALRPGKTYLVDALTLAQAQGRLIGNGATLKLRSSATAFLSINASGVTIEGVRLDANNLAGVYAVDIASGVTDTTLRKAEIKNVSSSAATSALVRVRGNCHRTVIDGCYLHDLAATNVGRGILISDTTGTVNGVKITHNTIENIERPEDGDGIVVQDFPNVVDVLIDGNTFRRCRKRSVKIQADGVTVVNNTMDHTYDAAASVVANSAISVYANRATIMGNTMSGVCLVGWIELGSSATVQDIVVTGNKMFTDIANRSATQDGITMSQFVAGLFRCTIANNTVWGARYGVRIQNAGLQISISNNHFFDITGSVIVLDDNGGTQIQWVTITGNTARTVANYFITTDGGNTPANCSQSGNHGNPSFGFYGSNAAGGFGGAVQSGALFQRRATDSTPVNNSTTLVTSTVLAVPVEPNATYIFESVIKYDASTAADLKFGWSAPAGATGDYAPDAAPSSTSFATASMNRTNTALGTTSIAGATGVGSANVLVARPVGQFTTASTAGTFAFQYAQAVADATDLTIRAGSWLRLTRIA